MKKLVLIFLVYIFVLTGCGNQVKPVPTPTKEQAAQIEQPTIEPTVIVTEAPIETAFLLRNRPQNLWKNKSILKSQNNVQLSLIRYLKIWLIGLWILGGIAVFLVLKISRREKEVTFRFPELVIY